MKDSNNDLSYVLVVSEKLSYILDLASVAGLPPLTTGEQGPLFEECWMI